MVHCGDDSYSFEFIHSTGGLRRGCIFLCLKILGFISIDLCKNLYMIDKDRIDIFIGYDDHSCFILSDIIREVVGFWWRVYISVCSWLSLCYTVFCTLAPIIIMSFLG